MTVARDLRAAVRVLERVDLELLRLEAGAPVDPRGGISIRDARRYARASDLLDRNQEELERIRIRMRRGRR